MGSRRMKKPHQAKPRAMIQAAAETPSAGKNSPVMFSLPEPVDTSRWLTDYSELFYDEWRDHYCLPVSRKGLATISRVNAHHGAMIYARRNMISGRFVGGGGLQLQDMQAFCHNWIQFGDSAFLKIRNWLGQVVRLSVLPAMYLRRRRDGGFNLVDRYDSVTARYEADDVIFIRQYDPEQQVYGLPDYLGGMQSALLNRDATLFRRKYFINGAHMGFIFYATDPDMDDEKEKEMKELIAQSKGVGNFRSLFVNIPNGKPDGIKIIPVGDIATKDEFANVKGITAQDVLTAHRFPAALAGIIPTNSGGLGDPQKYEATYAKTEVFPICRLIADACSAAGISLDFNLEV
jgi:PBSX family phage portal protein